MGGLEKSKMSEEETHSEKVIKFMKRKEENKKKYYVVFATDENDSHCYRRIGFYEGNSLTETEAFNLFLDEMRSKNLLDPLGSLKVEAIMESDSMICPLTRGGTDYDELVYDPTDRLGEKE
jgi:hypothetical protein